jgi:hypothetical protein
MMPLSKITVDLSISARASLPREVIDGYTEALNRGDEFPPVVAFRVADRVFLGDGFLRHAAHTAAGRKAMAVEVRVGGWREARMYAASAEANGRHGLPRTGPCRRLAVMFVLNDDEGKGWSQVQVAKFVGVSVPLVKAVQELLREGATPEKLAGAKLPWTQGGKMPQTPAAVVGRDEPPKPTPAPAPMPKPAAPKPPPAASINPWTGVLDGARKDEDDDEPEYDGADAPDDPEPPEVDDEDEELDAAQLYERMMRSGRKFLRYADLVGLDEIEAVRRVRQDMNEKAVIAKRRGRPEKPPALPPSDEPS